MKFTTVREIAMSLPEVTEEPHHDYGSFRVRGKIFVTMPPGEQVIHLFVSEEVREHALAVYPSFVEKLLWGGKARGVKVHLAKAKPEVVTRLVREAWRRKAPKKLAASGTGQMSKQRKRPAR